MSGPPKGARVGAGRDFRAILRRGARSHGRQVRGYWVARATGPSRLGLVVGRRVGNAVVRNRLKRILRGVFRETVPGHPPRDWVVIILPAAAAVSRAVLRQEMRTLFRR